MKLFLTIIALLGFYVSSGQKVFVEKAMIKDGTSIRIAIEANGIARRYSPNCGFKNVALLPDSAKIRLIGQLLTYVSDTTLYCIAVNDWTNHYMGKKWPSSKRYNTQISVLFFINYIALSSKAFVYSPFPVLYDKETHKEITYSCNALNEVVELYRKWFERIKEYGFVNYSLPLCDNRYQWFGSLMSNINIKEYPKWENYYSCHEIE